MIEGQKWYKSKCTSMIEPNTCKEGNVLNIPVNVWYDEESKMYNYDEYRLTLPINYELPYAAQNAIAKNTEDILTKMADYQEYYNTTKEVIE